MGVRSRETLVVIDSSGPHCDLFLCEKGNVVRIPDEGLDFLLSCGVLGSGNRTVVRCQGGVGGSSEANGCPAKTFRREAAFCGRRGSCCLQSFLSLPLSLDFGPLCGLLNVSHGIIAAQHEGEYSSEVLSLAASRSILRRWVLACKGFADYLRPGYRTR